MTMNEYVRNVWDAPLQPIRIAHSSLVVSMGNKQQQYGDVLDRYLKLDRSEAIYAPNDVVSGSILYSKRREAYVLLTGIVYYEKHQKKQIENCKVIFFSTKYNLNSSSHIRQNFQFHLDANLPPSFNNPTRFPRIIYSINLVSAQSKDRIRFSLPIHVCPIIQIDRPLLLAPLFFGPMSNLNYGTKLEVKLNRSAFSFDDIIQIYYELRNPNEDYINKIDISLGAYYLVESNIRQEDLSHSIENNPDCPSKQKLIRHKALLPIPHQISLPPTFKYKYDYGDEQSLFKLTIDYKIQFRISLTKENILWQVDIPIILCTELVKSTTTTQETIVDTIEE